MKNSLSLILKSYFKKGGPIDRQEFADHIGVSYRTLSNILSGDTTLSIDQIVKASDFLQVDLFKEYFKAIGRKEAQIVEDSEGEYLPIMPPEKKITVHLTLQASQKSFSKFPELLNTIREKGKSLGFDIS